MSIHSPSLLVPLLPHSDVRLDAETLATWHLALSSAISPELPHDLLALWLFTPTGPVLLGPTALAADHLEPPRPSPHLSSEATETFGRIFEQAGYSETLVQPVAYGRTDVALLVCAAFARSTDQSRRQALLLELAQRLAPMLARAAREWDESDVGHAPPEPAGPLLARLAQVPAADPAPAVQLRALFDALRPALPHEAAGVFVPGTADEEWYALHAHTVGPLWHSAECRLPEQVLERILHPHPAEIDRTADAWKSLFPGLDQVPASLLAAPLMHGGRRIGHLVFAAADAERYGARERRIFDLVVPYFAARVDGLLAVQEAAAARARASSLQLIPVQLGRLAALLATRPDAAAAWRELVAESTTLLPLRRMRLAVRLGQQDRVAYVTPGETRPFADLPSAPIVGTPLAEVLSGERPWMRSAEDALLEHALPLRVGGETIGALLISTAADEPLGRAHLALAQQLADLLAPHVELQRRPYVRPPFTPGWKRTSLP